jgi:hypothetical protein
MVAAADAALAASAAAPEALRPRRGSIMDSLVSVLSPKPRAPRRTRRADITPASTERQTSEWLAETLQGYPIDAPMAHAWLQLFTLNRVDGAALLSIQSDDELRDIFGIHLKGVRTRLLQDIEHERRNQGVSDSSREGASMDAMIRQTSHIIVRCRAPRAVTLSRR